MEKTSQQRRTIRAHTHKAVATLPCEKCVDERGELGVVREINALVTELSSDLVDAVEPSDDQLLEVELRRDAHEHLLLEVVMESGEGLGRGASGDQVHHGRLHLEEAALVEETTNVVDDLAAREEVVANLLVQHQIQIALAVTSPERKEKKQVKRHQKSDQTRDHKQNHTPVCVCFFLSIFLCVMFVVCMFF